jgi:predicted nucleic acid-binding protein
MATFIDTNVLIDVLDADPAKRDACAEKLNEAKARGRVLITDIVFSEFSISMQTVEEAEEVVRSLDITRVRCSAAGLFRAGRAYMAYKDENAGPKLNVLPDFIVGAHAAVEGAPLVTGDAKRMTTYFPELAVIKP